MLTQEEAVEKYGKVPLKFNSYYKYSFSFVGTADDGAMIVANIGGDADDIYKEFIEADEVLFLPYGFRSVTISLNSQVIYEQERDLW